jgi:transposase-like protein
MSDTELLAKPEPVRRLEVFTGAGRRRNWPAEQKARIVGESYESGETVCAVARRHGLTPQQLFGWRRDARRQSENLVRAEVAWGARSPALAELGIVAAQGDAGVNELRMIVADDRDERLPVDARASVMVLAAQLEALQTLIGSIEKRIKMQQRSNEVSQRVETLLSTLLNACVIVCTSQRDLTISYHFRIRVT